MRIAYILTPELRVRLKKPLGTLIRGSFKETMERVKEIVEKDKPVAIISVGDTVSKNLIENHMRPQLSIVDNKVMRRNIPPMPFTAEKTIRVINPPGAITEEAVTAIQEAIKNGCHVRIIVDGEEDLLTLIAVQYAPENSLVVYGQPYQGVVAVKVTQDKKAEVKGILKIMEEAGKAK
ncbi:MAG: DUF359 domain-containing protein [Candidatus Bathyarchaeia archaeon]